MKRAAATLIGLFIAVPAAWAQLVPMTPGQYMGSRAIGAIGDIAKVVGELATSNEVLENEIVNSRREFYDSPEGTARVAAAKRFETALFKRDLHYVGARITNDPNAGALLSFVINAAGTHDVDGGVAPYCHYEFTQWADELTSYLKPGKPLETSLKQAEPTYNKYREVRDLAEFLFFNPHGVLRAENPKPQEYLAAWILGTKYAKTVTAANAEATRIARQVGPARLAEIVAVLRDWTAVTYKLDGPGDMDLGAVLNPLVSGVPGEPFSADYAPQRLAFSEIRGRVLPAPYRLGPVIDEMQALWESGRKSHDAEILRAAVEKRDELLERMAAVNSMHPNSDNKIAFDLAKVRFNFLDRAFQASLMDAMQAGQKNPRSDEVAQQTREYLVTSSKLHPRSFTAQQTMAREREQPQGSQQRGTARRSAPGAGTAPASRAEPPVPPTASALAAGAAPVLPGLDEEGVGPFDRAIILAQQPKAAYVTADHLSNSLNSLARKWMNTSRSKNPETRRHFLGDVVKKTRQLIDSMQRKINYEKGLFGNLGAEQRRDYEERHAAQGAVIDELQARIPEMEKVIAAQ